MADISTKPPEKTGRNRFPIDDLMLLRGFVAVVEAQSFSRASARLGVSPSMISKLIKSLEQRLNSRLVTRSTKNLSITELGNRFYDRCLRVLRELDDAELEVGEYNAEPQGLLRVSCAPTLAVQHFGPIFVRFLERNPRVKLDVSLTVSSEDLISSGFDIGIRISSALDPNLIALKLAPNMRVYCASPAYLSAHGAPMRPTDLLKHNCLVMRGVQHSAAWTFRAPGKDAETIMVSGNFVADNGELLRQAILAGLGIGHLARFMVQQHLSSGELIELFPESRSVTSVIYAVYPAGGRLPLKARAFLDHLRAEFHPPPNWAV